MGEKTAIEVIAAALGGTYTARGDAVAVVEELKAAGFKIVKTYSESYMESVNAELSPEYRAAYDAISSAKRGER